jgi:uncharacterized protein YndB with AHSA1/START domain
MTPLTYGVAQARLADLRREVATQRHGMNPLPGVRGITFENTVQIDRSVEDVFAYLADFTNIPSWNYYVTEVRRVRGGAEADGAMYVQQRRNDSQRYCITVYDAPHRVGVQTMPGDAPAFTRLFLLQQVAGGTTRVTDSWHLDTGHPAPLQRLARNRARMAVADNLDRLKELLETGRTTLQDGRTVTIRKMHLGRDRPRPAWSVLFRNVADNDIRPFKRQQVTRLFHHPEPGAGQALLDGAL